MRILRRLVVLGLSATGLAIPFRGAAPVVITSRPVPLTSPAAYPASAKEHYLTTDQFGYVRPGLKVIVNGVAIGADRKPVVDVSYTDDADQPLDRLGKVTPGPVSISFILAWYDAANVQYTAYTTRTVTTPADSPHPGVTVVQAGTDSAGTAGFTDLSIGHSLYTFKTVLPEGFDQTKTTTLGVYATRNLVSVDPNVFDKNYYSNVEYDFRPDGQPVTEQWAAMDMAKTCNTCHDPLSAHGGARRDVKLCVLCHSPQTVDPDTGNTVDFKVMIHKIHDGEDLPSVQAGTPYQIIGFNQGINDFSKVAFPQDIRNCTKCHNADAPQGDIWYTKPNAAACGSCHDDVNFTTGENHPGGVQVDDSACASCHVPQGDKEFDASILGAHTNPTKSTQLPGLNATILSIAHTAPGEKPVVAFQVTNGDGTPVDPNSLARCRFLIGGPTTDIGTYIQEPNGPGTGAIVFDGTNATYTFTNAIPADAVGTWRLSVDTRRAITLHRGDGGADFPQNESALNPILDFAVTDPAPVPRRTVVSLANCNVCHDQIAFHGTQRRNTDECVICHNPNANDGADPVPQSISFQRFIHRIHRGENLTRDFVVAETNFREVLFPGDLRNCAKCHVNGSQELPLPTTNLPVQTPPPPLEWYTPQQTTAAACLGCHDTQEAAAHAFVNTAPFGEACAACHAPEDEFAVDKVHAR